MNFLKLETPRLLLTGLSPADMHAIFTRLPKAEIKTLLGHRSEADYLKEEHKHKNGYASYNRAFLLFLLTDKASGKIIGRCGIHNWNEEHKRAEIGYVMEDETFKRKGLMSEALSKIIDHAFRELKLHRLEALVGSSNLPSLRLMEINGFKQEGRLKEHRLSGKRYEDSLFFALLSDEYQATR